VNLCFAANFPTHDEADRMAERMAQAGINGVRLHHMDTDVYPNGILDPAHPLQLHPEACERLDYFIARLADRGIYVNLNLHVGRAASRHLGLPDPGTGYDKMVGLFMPALIDAQKQYARDLLGHVNPYRKLRYADDPAIAFVEITNEDSLFMWNAGRSLRHLPDPYAAQVRALYAGWLREQYGSSKQLGKAWSRGAEPMAKAESHPGWRLEQHPGCAAVVAPPTGTEGVLRVRIARVDGVGWHLQLKQTPFALAGGRHYTVSFRARAGTARPLGYSVIQDREPWGGLGLQGSVRLEPQWQSFRGRASLREDSPDPRHRLRTLRERGHGFFPRSPHRWT
jgi:hypothetical protein